MLPPREVRSAPESPAMDFREMTWWLNDMDEQGWEFVSHGQKNWPDGTIQDWWIFRRLISPNVSSIEPMPGFNVVRLAR